MSDLDSGMLEEFINESKDHLELVENDILSLEDMGADFDPEIVNRLFRAMHSVKGGSGFLNLGNVTKLAHSLENIFDSVRNHKLVVNERISESLLRSLDKLKAMIGDIENQGSYDLSQELSDLDQLYTSPILEGGKQKREEKKIGTFVESKEISAGDDDRIKKENSIGPDVKKDLTVKQLYVYKIEIDLVKSCYFKERLPDDLLKNMAMLGTLVDVSFQPNGIGKIDEVLPDSCIMTIRFSTVLDDVNLLAETLEIDYRGIDFLEKKIVHHDGDTDHVCEKSFMKAAGKILGHRADDKSVEISCNTKKKDFVKKSFKRMYPLEGDVSLNKSPHNNNPLSVASGTAPVTDMKKDNKQQNCFKQMDTVKVKISLSLLEKLMGFASELVLVRNQNIQAVEARDYNQLQAISKRLNVVTTNLQTGILQTRMQPVDLIFSKYKRIVRDLSRQLKKQIDVSIESNDVELDKNSLESLQDPLTHLVRNAIDHGIELPEDRVRLGKNAAGKLKISAYHNAGYVNIRINDDGKGMDAEKLIQSAVEKGIISAKQGEIYSREDAFNLIFKPGFSTAKEVSEISGRGVGMDVVKSNLQKIGGVININSKKGQGTLIDINLPLTLSIMQALIVLVQGVCFAIPEFNISEVVKLYGEEIYSKINLVNDQELYSLRGKFIPIIRLSKVLKMDSTFFDKKTGVKKVEQRNPALTHSNTHLQRRSSYENSIYILILKLGNLKFGLVVDEIIDTEEIVIKALHEQLKKIKVFIGTTVLGDGRIATIVDIANLAELADFNINKVETKKDKKHTKDDDKQVVLTFNICGDEVFAIPLFLIGHIEKINSNQIMIANKKEYFKYQKDVVQLIHIEDALEDITAHYLDEMFVLIIKGIKPIGILVSQIIDTILISSDIDTHTIRKPGIIGATLINDQLTLILDVFSIIDKVEPMWTGQSMTSAEVKKKQVLLLEDMKFYKSLLSSYLVGTGMDVSVASNGKEGMELLMKKDFDIIISDLQMPVMDGFQFAENVRKKEEWKGIKMIAISSMYDKEEGEKIVKEYGFQTYIDKLDREGLLLCLSQIIS